MKGSRPPTRPEILRTLRLVLWVVPLVLATIGTLFTLFENQRHRFDSGWPWPTILGVLVLGVLGPVIAWLFLRWANGLVDAYLESQSELASKTEELTALNNLARAASDSLDLDARMATILDWTVRALRADAGMVFLREDSRAGLRLAAHHGISPDMARKESRLRPGHCLCGEAVGSRQILYAGDVHADQRCTSDVCICEGFRSVACAPLLVKGKLVGLLQLASRQSGHFTPASKDFLAAVSGQAGVSIENARLYETVRTFNMELERKVSRRTRELEAARWNLAEKARQLRQLLNQSYRVQEDTQARIAHDMHDSVTQLIIGALYETQAARQAVYDDPDRASESLARAQEHLAGAEAEIRRAIYDLHPPVLDTLGLVVALKRLCTTFQATFGIQTRVKVSNQTRRLATEVEVAIYRIVQAALNNVAAHAQAEHVSVALRFEEDSLLVVVEDDGVGFDPEEAIRAPGEHLGLIGMRERAEAHGAALVVDSSPERGTRITLTLPSPEYLAPVGDLLDDAFRT